MSNREVLEKEVADRVRATASLQELASMQLAATLFKVIAWAVGMGCMAVAFFNPGLITLVPAAILVYIAAEADCNIDKLKQVIREEIERRQRDK